MIPNIFLIDDDPMQLCLGEFLIKQHGNFGTLTSFINSVAAIEYITLNYRNSALLPDIIFLDLDMPNLNGWGFLNLFAKVEPFMEKPIAVFVISSKVDGKNVNLLKRYSFVKGTYTKPINIVVVQRIFQEIVVQNKINRMLVAPKPVIG